MSDAIETERDDRAEALRLHLDADADDVSESVYGENTYDGEGGEYLVLEDHEADVAAAEYIRESLWAFNPSFLVDYLPDGVDVPTVRLIQEKCEDANPALLSMVESQRRQHRDGNLSALDVLYEDAIAADGRGHFLSHYDGEESEEDVGGVTYYIYRVN